MTGMQLDDVSGCDVAAQACLRKAGFEKDKNLTVFLLPGLSGDVGEFSSLLSPPDASLHFVPIHYRHWSRLRSDANELDRLVADCVGQIESYGPRAKVFLLGYSFGAQMACDVARAMIASGHRIGLLGLIDAPARPQVVTVPASTAERLHRLIRGIRRGETADQLARFSAGALFRPQAKRARAVFKWLHGFGLFPRMLNRIDLNIQMRFHLILLNEWLARMASFDDRLLCPTTLFRGSSWPLGADADLGWTRYLGKLRVVTISGDHGDVLQPQNAEQIISEITAIISKSDGVLPH
ncbi:thioesterase domain-containing protein [Rhodopila sp.]|uniref:thioesterase domain-containing protein n=1 Tax=Rhodopila sp. TaxID=2480087 RepID=UPI003D0FDEDA